jgi:uncharacterized protein YjbI with pentapeptide repeats
MSGADDAARISNGLEPQRAAVVPRGRVVGSIARLPLETLLCPMIAAKTNGIVRLIAPPGGGKSVALRHLQAVLPADPHLHLCDDPCERLSATGLFVVTGSIISPSVTFLVDIEICPWTVDDCIEYLCAMHRAQCAAVLNWLVEESAVDRFEGSPQLLSLVMDAMARDVSGTSAMRAFRRELQRIIPAEIVHDQPSASPPVSLDADQRKWWRHEVVRQIVCADWIAEELCRGRVPELLADMAMPELVPMIAEVLCDRVEASAALEQLVERCPTDNCIPMAVSVLIQAIPGWRPKSGQKLKLLAADLSSARWAGIDLREATLTDASLVDADLTGADLTNINAMADFTRAVLRGARMSHVQLQKSNMCFADLSGVVADHGNFVTANLEGADLSGADFSSAQFCRTSLQCAVCTGTNFTRAQLSMPELDRAIFSNCRFDHARFDHVDMRGAQWDGASFVKATFLRCNLEGLNSPAANFRSADLTESLLSGSFMPGANFRDADLSKTGLADVMWENADLRNANFTHASFHLGSTRSGLVGSTIASEGTRTGFYTDDYTEMNFKSPEEIRKANLRGANLLDAIVHRTDFYLVDLRNAVYSPGQGEHFRRCGAILK